MWQAFGGGGIALVSKTPHQEETHLSSFIRI